VDHPTLAHAAPSPRRNNFTCSPSGLARAPARLNRSPPGGPTPLDFRGDRRSTVVVTVVEVGIVRMGVRQRLMRVEVRMRLTGRIVRPVGMLVMSVVDVSVFM
jgi:hypothetical protein